MNVILKIYVLIDCLVFSGVFLQVLRPNGGELTFITFKDGALMLRLIVSPELEAKTGSKITLITSVFMLLVSGLNVCIQG